MDRTNFWETAGLIGVIVGAGVLSALISFGAHAQPAAKAPPSAPAATAASPLVDPAALQAVKRMSGYLRGLKTFEVTAETTTDEVVGDDMKLQFASRVVAKVRRPDGFVIQTSADRKVRQFYYNGKSLTVAAPRMGFYAQVPAPGTIAEVLNDAYDRFGIELPLADLIYWGEEGTSRDLVRAAVNVGYARIGDTDCDQYAFRGPALDWQIWIQRGDQPVPRKIVITTRDDPAKPQYVSVMRWTVNPSFPPDAFSFTPPKDAAQIRVAERGQ